MAHDPEDAEMTSDVDAEGEEEMEIDDLVVPARTATRQSHEVDAEGDAEDNESSDNPDAEGDEEEDAEGEEDDETTANGYHGAVKVPENESEASDADGADQSDEDESAGVQSGSDSSSLESDDENEWEAGSVEAEDMETDIVGRNSCVFCGQDEEHDPGEEFEEYLACAICGDNAHRQCARDGNSLLPGTDAAKWRCPSCTKNDLEADSEGDEEHEVNEQQTRGESIQRRLSTSSSRLTKELLPAVRGGSKPGSHSIFNTLVPEDEPADGSRTLRKRKASSEVLEIVSRASSRRPKSGDNDDQVIESPPVAQSRARSGTAASRNQRIPATNAPATPAALEVTATQASTRPQRQRKPKKEELPAVRLVSRSSDSLLMAFRVDLSKIKPPKRKRDRDRNRNRNQNRVHKAEVDDARPRPRFATSVATPYTTPFYAFHEREEDEKNQKPYRGILTEAEANNDKTFPEQADRAKFDKARRLAEEEWKERTAASEAEQEVKGRASQKVAGPPSKIKCISFGGWEIDTWYAAPYPEEYSRNRVLYICEFCLKYMGSDYVAWRHKLKCPMKHPPGDEIYREGSVSVFEVDGRKNPAYCQNLCLLAKLFLGSKTLYYDVEPFLFYIMTEYDELGCHFVGYFSKEKRPSSLNNVSCILTLPIHQRKGYGNLLIDFSYLLTRVEKKTGSPEKPLSDMGLVSYRNYWRLVLCYLLRDYEGSLSITDISEETGMTADDIVAALEALRALVRDPVTKTYALRLDTAYFQETIDKWEAKGYVRLNPDALMWTPYVMGRSNLANYDRPALATIAPREGEDDESAEPEEGVQQQQRQLQQKVQAGALNGILSDGPLDDQLMDLALTSVVLPDAILSDGASSPAKPPGPLLTNGETASKGPNEAADSPIPPTRYELYPPVPGTSYRARRGGYRPKGSRITPHGPVFGGPASLLPGSERDRNRNRNRNRNRAPAPLGAGKPIDALASPSLRKTRSQIGTPVGESAMETGAKALAGEDDADDGKDAIDNDDSEPGGADQDAEGEDDDDAEGYVVELDADAPDAEAEDEEYVEGEEDAEGEDDEEEEEEELEER